MLPEALTQAIELRLKEAEPKPFAVFDFDNTCIVNDMGDAIFAYLAGHNLLRDRALLSDEDTSDGYDERVFNTNLELLAAGHLKAAYMLNARLFSGYSPGEAEALALATITEEGSKLGSKMLFGHHIERGLQKRREIALLIDFLRKRQVELWIVSATAEPAIRAAMKHFGIDGYLIASRSTIKNDVYTQELQEPLSMFEGKAECIKKFIDPSKVPFLVAGDSTSDLSMLEMADIKVVVDRNNELSKIARERGWFLL